MAEIRVRFIARAEGGREGDGRKEGDTWPGGIVFFGRFVAVLRVLGSFLAGTNRLAWLRFFVSDATGAIVWATIYGFAAYHLGRLINHLAKPAGIGLCTLALIGLIGLVWFLRSHEAELEKKAEAVLPGPLRPARRDSD